MRLKLISCEVLHREMAAASARSPNYIEVEFLAPRQNAKGCAVAQRRLQSAINRADRLRFQAVLLGYGLCRRELAGLKAQGIPLVMPRNCDCIAPLLGVPPSRWQTTASKPSIAFHTGCPVERNTSLPKQRNKKSRFPCGLEHLAARFGPEVARFFSDEFLGAPQNTPLLPKLPELNLGRSSRSRMEHARSPQRCGPDLLLDHESFALSMIQQMVDGYWSYEQFLVVPPGWRVVINLDETLSARQDAS